MNENTVDCPVCENTMKRIDVPNKDLYACSGCDELGQVLENGLVSPLSLLLEKNRLGDDQIRAAMSTPHVATVESFIECYDASNRYYQRDMATTVAQLRTNLVQIENRISVGISKLSEMALVDDSAQEAVNALTEARDMVSTSPRSTRGIPDDSNETVRAEG